MKLHKSLTENRIVRAVENDNGEGFCVSCGADAENWCEPDMKQERCHGCGEMAVYGAEQLLFHIVC